MTRIATRSMLVLRRGTFDAWAAHTRAMRARATSSRRLLRSTRALTPAVAFRAWAATASLAHLAHGVRAAAALSLAQTHARAAHRRAHGRVFAAWRALSARAHACAALLHRATSRRKARAEQSVFTAWRMCARVRSRARARFASVRHRTVSAVFDAWRCRTRDEQLRSRALTAVCSQHYRATTRAGFNRWARAVALVRDVEVRARTRGAIAARAGEMRESMLAHRALCAWFAEAQRALRVRMERAKHLAEMAEKDAADSRDVMAADVEACHSYAESLEHDLESLAATAASAARETIGLHALLPFEEDVRGLAGVRLRWVAAEHTGGGRRAEAELAPCARSGHTLTPFCYPGDLRAPVDGRSEGGESGAHWNVLCVGGERPGEVWYGDAKLLKVSARGSCIAWCRTDAADAAEGPLLPPRAGHASAFVGGARVVVFGGYDGSDDLGDTHVLSITETLQGPTLKAGPLVLATHSTPLARSQHTLVSTPGVPNASYRVLAADGRDNVAVLEGTPSEGGVASDGIPARGAQCVLFGGYASGKGVLGDTWVLDLSTRRWLRPSVGGTPPRARCGHACTMLLPAGAEGATTADGMRRSSEPSAGVAGGLMLVHGGFDGQRFLSDLFAYDVALATWKELDALGPSPCARRGHALAASGEDALLYGGFCASSDEALCDLHVLRRARAAHSHADTEAAGRLGTRARSSDPDLLRDVQIWQWQRVDLGAPTFEGALGVGAACIGLGGRLLLWGGHPEGDDVASPPEHGGECRRVLLLEDASRAHLHQAAASVRAAERAHANAAQMALKKARIEAELAEQRTATQEARAKDAARARAEAFLRAECSTLRGTLEAAEMSAARAELELVAARTEIEQARATATRERARANESLREAAERSAAADSAAEAASERMQSAVAESNASMSRSSSVAAELNARLRAADIESEVAEARYKAAAEAEAAATKRCAELELQLMNATRECATAKAGLEATTRELERSERLRTRLEDEAKERRDMDRHREAEVAADERTLQDIGAQLRVRESEIESLRAALDRQANDEAERLESIRSSFAIELAQLRAQLRERTEADAHHRAETAEMALAASRAMEAAALEELHAAQAKLLDFERSGTREINQVSGGVAAGIGSGSAHSIGMTTGEVFGEGIALEGGVRAPPPMASDVKPMSASDALAAAMAALGTTPSPLCEIGLGLGSDLVAI